MDSVLPNISHHLTMGVNDCPYTPVSKYHQDHSTPTSTFSQPSSACASSQKRGRSCLYTAISGVKTLRERSRSPSKRTVGHENASPTSFGRSRRNSVKGLYDTFRSRGSSTTDNHEEDVAATRPRITSPFKNIRKLGENTSPQPQPKRRKSLSDILIQATDKAYNSISRHSTSPHRRVKLCKVELEKEAMRGRIDERVEEIHESRNSSSVQIPRPRVRIPTPFPRDRENSASEDSMNSSKERLGRLVDNFKLEGMADRICVARPVQETFDEAEQYKNAYDESTSFCSWDTRTLGQSDEQPQAGLQRTIKDRSHNPDSYICELIAAHDKPAENPRSLTKSAASSPEHVGAAEPKLLCALPETPPDFSITEFSSDTNDKPPRDAQHQENHIDQCNTSSALSSILRVKDLDPQFRNRSQSRMEKYKILCETPPSSHLDATEALCQSSPGNTSDRLYQANFTSLDVAVSQKENLIPIQLESRASSHMGIGLTSNMPDVVNSTFMQRQDSSLDSYHPSRQPHSAPSGVAAQLSENFQHFRKDIIQAPHDSITGSDERLKTGKIHASVVAQMTKNWHFSAVSSNSGSPVLEEDSVHLHRPETSNEFWDVVLIGRSILRELKKFKNLKYIPSNDDIRKSGVLLLEQILEESIELRRFPDDVSKLCKKARDLCSNTPKDRHVSTAPVRVRFPGTENAPKYTEIYGNMSKAMSELYNKSEAKLSNHCTWDPVNRIIEAFPRDNPPLVPMEMDYSLQYIWLPMQELTANVLPPKDPLVQEIGANSLESKGAVPNNSLPNKGASSRTSSTSSRLNPTMGSSSKECADEEYRDFVDWAGLSSMEMASIVGDDSGTEQELKTPPPSEQSCTTEERVANEPTGDFDFEAKRHGRSLVTMEEDSATRSPLSQSGDELSDGEISEDEIDPEAEFDVPSSRRCYRSEYSGSEASVTHIEDIAKPRSLENGSATSERPLSHSSAGTGGARTLKILSEFDLEVVANTALEFLRSNCDTSSEVSMRSNIHPLSGSMNGIGIAQSSDVDIDSEFELDINATSSHHDSDFTNSEVPVRRIRLEDIVRPSSVASSWDNPADNESIFIGPTRTWPDLAQVALAPRDPNVCESGPGLGRSTRRQDGESSCMTCINMSEILKELSGQSDLRESIEEASIEEESLGDEYSAKPDNFRLPSLTDRVDIFSSTLYEYARALKDLQRVSKPIIQDQGETTNETFLGKDAVSDVDTLIGNTKLQPFRNNGSLESEDLFEDTEFQTRWENSVVERRYSSERSSSADAEIQCLREDNALSVGKTQDSNEHVNLRITDNIAQLQGGIEERKVSATSFGSGISFKTGFKFSVYGHIFPVEECTEAPQCEKSPAEDDSSGVIGDHTKLLAEILDDLCMTTYEEPNDKKALPLEHFNFKDRHGANAEYPFEVGNCADLRIENWADVCQTNRDYSINTELQEKVCETEDFGFGGISKVDDDDIFRYEIGDSDKICEAPAVELSQFTSTTTLEDLNLGEAWKAHNDHCAKVEIQDKLCVVGGFGTGAVCQADDCSYSSNGDQSCKTAFEELSSSPSKVTLKDLNLRVVGKAAGERKKIGALIDIFQAQGIMPQSPKYNIHSPPKFASFIGQSSGRPTSVVPASTMVGLRGKVGGVKTSPLKHWAVFARPSSRLSYSEDTDVSSVFGEQLERFGVPAFEDGDKEDIDGARYHG